MKPPRLLVKSGDVVRIEIEGIGRRSRNAVIDEPADTAFID